MRQHFTAMIVLLGLCLSLACSSGSVFQSARRSSLPDTVLTSFSINPQVARDSIVIRYNLLRDVRSVSLHIYNVQGDFVQVLTELPSRVSGGVIDAWTWDLRDFSGRRVAPGNYQARLHVDAGEENWQMTQLIPVF